MSAEYSVNRLCATLEVSPSGYHAWLRRATSQRAQANADLLPLISQAHRESRQTYGSPRITHWLHQHGQPCGRVRVAKLMRQAGINRRSRRRFRPVSLTDSDHPLPVATNRLLAQAPPVRPNTVWVADITYVETDEGWLYVAGILDRCSRRCLGWAMGDSLHTALPLAALDMALTHRRPHGGLLHHSDQGVQYASRNYRQRLNEAGAIASMSRRGNCYDNAVMESFWSSLKRELVYRRTFATHAAARAAIFEWIEVFYNRERLHSALGFQSPVDFENQIN